MGSRQIEALVSNSSLFQRLASWLRKKKNVSSFVSNQNLNSQTISCNTNKNQVHSCTHNLLDDRIALNERMDRLLKKWPKSNSSKQSAQTISIDTILKKIHSHGTKIDTRHI